MVAGLALVLVQPMISKLILDNALMAHNIRLLNQLGLAFLVVAILSYVTSILRQYYFAIVQQRVMTTVRKEIALHILRLPMAFHDRQNPGYLMARTDADVGNLAGVMTDRYIQTLVDVLTLVGAIAMLIALNWRLALLSMASLPLFTWSALYFGRKMRTLSWKNQETHAQVAAQLQDVFNLAYIIKVFGCERTEVRRLIHQLHNFVRSTMEMTVLGLLCNLSMGCIATLAPLSIIWYGGYQVIQGSLTIGGLFAFNMYVAYLFTPLRNIYSTIQSIQASVASLERIFEIIDQPVEGSGLMELSPVAPAGSAAAIEFRDVTFSYQTQTPALAGISFRVERGETVALVGPSGAGKTTIFHLLLRLYDYQTGTILLDGIGLKEYSTGSIRRVTRMVPQDAHLFNRSIAENICFGSPGASPDDVESSAARAHIDRFINGLPNQYQTSIGQRGTMLSGGQRQRISIARALVSQPRILLLDEATAFLDANTESDVQHAMSESARGRTCLVIAHRLSTVLDSDRIVVIDKGRVIDQGTHVELYSRCPLYAGLCDKQFRHADTIQAGTCRPLHEEGESLASADLVTR
jgi:subfamily B ATP-binding cassette protein MsbA